MKKGVKNKQQQQEQTTELLVVKFVNKPRKKRLPFKSKKMGNTKTA